MPALVITAEGDVNLASVPSESHARLAWMYEQISCHTVDVVRLPYDQDMWIDDEGLDTKPVNILATIWARYFGGLDTVIHGDVILAKHDGPETVELSNKEATATLLTLEKAMDMALGNAMNKVLGPDGPVIVPVEICPN